ncbi:MAG: 4-hydroxy-tetrahydrodipicolinate synthase [Gammaproteobacteria bacterium]|nr:4-hydroxy-tetrahydrodipicolinate synthase [Gammaproteobacteria bacterium]
MKHSDALTGSIVALVTPMNADKSLDLKAFEKLVEWHKEEGTDGIVIAGTTGEAPTLDAAEVMKMLDIAIDVNAGKMKLILGNGGISTEKTVAYTKSFRDYAIDGFLTCTPYYVKPTQKGMFEHFKAVADSAHKPVCLYNVPGRTGVDLSNETIFRLAEHDNINAIKDATGNLQRAEELIGQNNSQLSMLSGDDETSHQFLKMGGSGVISVTANVVPRMMADRGRLILSGELAEADKIEELIKPFHTALFIEANPIPVKWALHQMKMIQNELRLPMTPLETQPTLIEKIMHQLTLVV